MQGPGDEEALSHEQRPEREWTKGMPLVFGKLYIFHGVWCYYVDTPGTFGSPALGIAQSVTRSSRDLRRIQRELGNRVCDANITGVPMEFELRHCLTKEERLRGQRSRTIVALPEHRRHGFPTCVFARGDVRTYDDVAYQVCEGLELEGIGKIPKLWIPTSIAPTADHAQLAHRKLAQRLFEHRRTESGWPQMIETLHLLGSRRVEILPPKDGVPRRLKAL